MGLFASIASTASAAISIATSANYDIDWSDAKVSDAAIVHWTVVKEKADAALPLAGLRLTAEQKKRLDQLLKGESVLPDQPTHALLRGLPEAIPPASLNRIVGSVIDECIKSHKHDEVPEIPLGEDAPQEA
ncbi:hypothetical protein IWQ56_004018 [Coemansia nantahalensis]|uniref:Uncharacterized protein n=2 Tax=Coemansia TaxID=4863 RepID=A0ACC1LAI4_9FUNG|nr:hypothetical protein IWQ56_004018 [Coemansia nantahalensis]KAJ2770064.1 hypothetical protein IWQ57_002828 [Coemansia nantahalensis]KAJ2804154.1 hypothetical protein H4R21_001754 [Coemansia helicoidea]